MKFQSRASAPYLAAFNFSSLTDIVMLLLIFFLLASSFVTTRGLDVVLPQAVNADAAEEARLYLSVDDKGGIMLNDRATSLAELPVLVRAALARDTTQVVVIRADQTLALGGIVEILDAVKGAGARRFFIATEAPEEAATTRQP